MKFERDRILEEVTKKSADDIKQNEDYRPLIQGNFKDN
jgi:hypothetical protein